MLRGDLLAGLTVAALAVPQSLGYAAIAGVPVEVGLYAVPVALIAYAFFGTSRQLVVGPVSTVAVLSGALVASFDPADPAQAVAYTLALALGAGVVLIAAGLLRIGWVSEFLSKPIVTGFVIGLTVLVVIGELPKILGIPAPEGDVLARIGDLVRGFGQGNTQTLAIGLAALLVLFGGSRLAPRAPWALLVVVAAIVASAAGDWADDEVAVVGPIPAGFPTPGLPDVSITEVGTLLVAGAALALVGIAEGLSAARLFATEGGYRVDADQELVATGVANVGTGLFGGLAVAGSLSKTAAAVRSQGRSQITGLVTAAVSILVIAFLTPALEPLPLAVLSAVVIHAVWGLLDVAALRRYRQVRRNDFVAALVACVGVLALGPLPGLGLAIAASVVGLVYRSTRVRVDVLGRIPGEKAAYGSISEHGERLVISGILVLRVGVPVFWVNAMSVRDRVMDEVDAAPDTQAVVLDVEGTSQLDTTSADAIADLASELHSRTVDLYVVRVPYPVRMCLRRSGAMELIGEDHIWHSISQAVRQAHRDHGIPLERRPADRDDAEMDGTPQDRSHPYGFRRSSGEDEHGHLET